MVIYLVEGFEEVQKNDIQIIFFIQLFFHKVHVFQEICGERLSGYKAMLCFIKVFFVDEIFEDIFFYHSFQSFYRLLMLG